MTLNVVLRQLEEERNRLRSEISQIENAVSVLQGRTTLRKRKLSAAAIARIRTAQKARWAKWRKAQRKG